MLSARVDFQDAMAKGLGVTEYDRQGRAAQEIEALWSWTRAQFEGTPSEMLVDNRPMSTGGRISRLRSEECLQSKRGRKLGPAVQPKSFPPDL